MGIKKRKNGLTDLDDGHLAPEHHDDAHLEEDPEGVTNVVCMELLEALGAVAALEEEGVAHGGVGEAVLKAAGLAGEDDRREGLEGPENGLELLLAWVLGQLEGLLRLPALQGPLRLASIAGGGGGGLGRLLLWGLVGDDGVLGGLCGMDGLDGAGAGAGPGLEGGVVEGGGWWEEGMVVVGWDNGFGGNEGVGGGDSHCGCWFWVMETGERGTKNTI